jgi:hypothetical protein
MPFMNELGSTFVTAPYHFGDSNVGYTVRVLSVSNGTTIGVPALSYEGVHDAGSFHSFDYPFTRFGTTIHCSQPCIAVQYAKEAVPGDGPGGVYMMPFMLVLTPHGRYTKEVVFSSPAWATDTTAIALSLVTDFFPVDDVYLDGVNLDYLNWMIAPDGTGSFATVNITTGQHRLFTFGEGHR